ncbi:MAG: glycosyltransferase family 2 protein [Actinomycetota bacterium]
MPVSKLTIAVPVYNERARIARALKELSSTPFPVETEVIVVDDGSGDGTWEELGQMMLPENVRLIRHPQNKGKGAALRSALEAASGDVFVPFDADLEYDPGDLAKCLQPLVRDEADVVYGTRIFGAHTAFSYWYVLGNKVLNTWANVLYNCYISDLETCFKMVRTSILRSLDLRADGFDIEAEVTAKLLRDGHRPYEVPISYKARTRAQGKKIAWQDGVIALWVIAKIRFGAR